MGPLLAPNRMVPSGAHVPPRGSVAVAAISCTAPPKAGVLLSFPSAKNPTQRLSGDQNGFSASPVPGNGCAVTSSNGRTQRTGRLLASPATNASVRPLGERANCTTGTVALTDAVKMVFSGGLTDSR